LHIIIIVLMYTIVLESEIKKFPSMAKKLIEHLFLFKNSIHTNLK